MMNDLTCGQVLDAMDAVLDGESQVDLGPHLAGCPACQDQWTKRQRLSAALKAQARHYAEPAGFAARFQKTLNAEQPPAKRNWRFWTMGAGSGLALAASLVLVLFLPASPDPLPQDLVSAHLRSLMPGHLIDVESSDRHTVKPWFNGRLDLSPAVPDLSGQGYPLIGGRLDYVDQHNAAALVYRCRQHVINLFIWSKPGIADSGLVRHAANGYTTLSWTFSGLSYAVVSDLNPSDLAQFQQIWAKEAGIMSH